MASLLFDEYWSVPDGTSCHRKAFTTTKMGAAVGMVASAYNLVFFPPNSTAEGILRAGKYTLSMAAIGAIFGVTSCVSAQIREKPDDPLNYFFGGCAAGLTLGARMHNYTMGAAACVYMGAGAALWKAGKMEGWQMANGPPRV